MPVKHVRWILLLLCLSLLCQGCSKEKQLPFRDVPEGSWCCEAVSFCYQNGLISGVSDTEFEPDGSLTRAVAVTVLYRLEGSPEPDGEALQFTDVPQDWYYDPVLWGMEAGIVSGTSDTEFSPEEGITREQVAAMLYRYAGQPEVQVDLTAISDADAISDYAGTAVSWAYELGIITCAEDGALEPAAQTTRGEFAVMIWRYVELVNGGCLRHAYDLVYQQEAGNGHPAEEVYRCRHCNATKP